MRDDCEGSRGRGGCKGSRVRGEGEDGVEVRGMKSEGGLTAEGSWLRADD